MSDKNIIISADGEDEQFLSINFTRKKFQEFIHSLVSTPREENQLVTAGYDLDKPNLRLILERLDQHVSTNYDVVNRDFLCAVLYPEDRDLVVTSFEQFFATEELAHEDPHAVSTTTSYLVGLNRDRGQRSYEKQVVTIIFVAGNPGLVRIMIRSTEITWSAGIFALLNAEIKKLEARTAGSAAPSQNKLLVLTPIFRKASRAKSDSLDSSRQALNSVTATAAISAYAALAGMFFAVVARSKPVIFNSDLAKLEPANASALIAELGAERAAEILQVGNILRRSGVDYVDGYRPFQDSITNVIISVSPVALPTGIVLAVYCLLCIRHARELDNHFLGRIFGYPDFGVGRSRARGWT